MKRTEGTGIERSEYGRLPRCPLIVCGVLVQNPANLGGLCRTCEAFRLEALVLANLAISQTAAFCNLAASAHHWQPLLSCPIDHLSNWLATRQQAGYRLIALHSDPQATDLARFAFPHRSVLVLGQELTGIPVEVVSRCDDIVTIRQWGMVESLNVQTAAAIAIYEYMRQHGPRSDPT